MRGLFLFCRRTPLLLAICAALLGSPGAARARVHLHGLFTNGVVLQRDKPMTIWGRADNGEQVTIELGDQRVTTTAAQGRWRVRLAPRPAGGPLVLTVRGSASAPLTVRDVMIGEVWLCAGQSNMAWPLGRSATGNRELARAKRPGLRLLTVPARASDAPETRLATSWRRSSAGSAAGFSAICYYFGAALQDALGADIAVGLIASAWANTPAEAWTSRAALVQQPKLRSIVSRWERYVRERYPRLARRYPERIAAWRQASARARQAGQAAPRRPRRPRRPSDPRRPSCLFNGKIHPLVPFALRGVVWYQGESNAKRPRQYHALFPALIADWRRAWGEPRLPFLFVQLAPFAKHQPDQAWAALMEAQRLTASRVPRTAMIAIPDLGERYDLHPRRKRPVGQRLARAARALVHGEQVAWSGPTLREMAVQGRRAVLTFDNVGGGLAARGERLVGFTVAGADRRFLAARAEIEQATVIVSHPEIDQPVAVRFGWSDYPVVNLYNAEGLPAGPFRTDDYPLPFERR